MKKQNNNIYDSETTAYIEFIYRDGEFFDKRTGEMIKLKVAKHTKGVHGLMEVPISALHEEDFEFHQTESKAIIQPAGSVLYFDMPYTAEGKMFYCEVLLKENLSIVRKGNKPRRSSCKCEVVSIRDSRDSYPDSSFKPIPAESLHQAFFQISLLYRPKNKSHNCNVFKTFKTKNGLTLESILP